MVAVYIAGKKVRANMGSNMRPSRSPNRKSQLIAWLVLVSITPAVLADAAFRTTGEYGEASFSDVEMPGATQIELPVTVVDPVRIADQQAIVDQQLRVAKALEDSRLARQAAATERLLALAASRPQVVYVEPQEYRSPNGYYFPYRPPGWRPHWKDRKYGRGPTVATASARARRHSRGLQTRRPFEPIYPGIPRGTTVSARQPQHRPSGARPSGGTRQPARANLPMQ